MIDFHNHILPNVDDGAKTMHESIEMLKCASLQGITDIVQTVHFQHPKMEGKNVDYDYLTNKVRKLQEEIDKENLNIKIHLSAEVYYAPNLVEISDNPLVTIGNGKYMLIEFATNIFPTGYEEQFYYLQLNGITPIIAHPERYRFIQNDINIMQMWIDRGYVIQIDAGSTIGQFGTKIKELVYKIIEKGLVHLIGSDAHNSNKRNFCLFEAYDFLEKNNSIENVKKLKENSFRILSGKNMNLINSNYAVSKIENIKERLFKFIKFR